MGYIINCDIIPRNIAGVYFLVDIHEKDYYVKQEMFTTNQCGYEIFRIMKSLPQPFTLPVVFEKFTALLSNYSPEMDEQIHSDIQNFVGELICAKYVREVTECGYAND